MAEFKPTRDQQRAIEARDSAILVSAAAGSGKTKVLTERLMGYITGPAPKSIDSFLIITYTRAAAGELRSRIMDELNARMGADPSNTALRRQYGLVARAQISTIHGFCANLLREHCLPLGLDPDFKIVDEGRTAAMKQAALETVLEACYERIDTDSGMRALIDTVGAGRDDRRLAEIVLQLHGKMQSHAYPEVWADGQRKALYAEGLTDPGETMWGRFLLDSAGETADYWARVMEAQLGLMAMPEFAYIGDKYAESFGATADSLRNFAAATKLGWDKAHANSDIEFPTLKRLVKPAHPAVTDAMKERRKACQKATEKLWGEFARPGAEIMAELRQIAPPMEALLDLTLEFDRVFAKEKKRRGLVDYGDLEHFAARLLSDSEGKPTELARQISRRYTEIMVDEYQDVSEVQELIFRCVSDNETNLFTVGDVKQSIYRFRLAEPAIFTGKYLTYADYEAAPAGAPRRILLQENFRSRREILDASNAVFENIMSTRLGELEYDENARLRCGAAYYTGDVPKPCLQLLAVDKGDEEDEDGTVARSAREQEAAYVAAQIETLIARGLPVTQGDTTRPARYEDVVILLRNANAVGPVFCRALEERGIPVQSQQSSGFYTRPEISALMALLSVIDNPMQDLPLITALRSGYVGFSPDELARARAADKKGSYYEALVQSADSLPPAAAFLEKLGAWRRISGDVTLRELIWRVMEDLNMAAVTAAMTDGQLRRRNLMAFLELTSAFEATGVRGLRQFLVWLDRQREAGVEPEVATGLGTAGVQIMSIHKSKGLEFPIVFLSDTAHRFNTADTKAAVLIHPEFGLGPKVVDSDRGLEYPSMPRRALAGKLRRETLSEEMRLLYVAMTRAKEYLLMTAGVKEPEKMLDGLRATVTRPVAPQVLESAGGMAHWIAAAALADGQQHLTVEIVYSGSEAAAAQVSEEATTAPEADAVLVQEIADKLAYRYPHPAAVTLPSKVTATELKYLTDDTDAEAAALVQGGARRFRRFRPDGQNGRVSAVEKGVATHLVFQHIAYENCVDTDSVQTEIDRLHARGILNDRQRKAVNVAQVAGFFASPAGALMRAGDSVLREFKFSLLRPARDYFPEAGEDEVLLQGVIDCAVERDGRYTVIDYKTDNVTADQVPERAGIYASQVEAYRQALEEMTGKPVEKTVLYFLKPGVAWEM